MRQLNFYSLTTRLVILLGIGHRDTSDTTVSVPRPCRWNSMDVCMYAVCVHASFIWRILQPYNLLFVLHCWAWPGIVPLPGHAASCTWPFWYSLRWPRPLAALAQDNHTTWDGHGTVTGLDWCIICPPSVPHPHHARWESLRGSKGPMYLGTGMEIVCVYVFRQFSDPFGFSALEILGQK